MGCNRVSRKGERIGKSVMSLLRTIRGGILRSSFGNVAGAVVPSRSMGGVLKVPASDPYPDVTIGPDEFFGDLPPSAEEMAIFLKTTQWLRDLKQRYKTEAYEVDFVSSR